jgi:hypothetical protein
MNLPSINTRIIGKLENQQFGLPRDARLGHIHIIGLEEIHKNKLVESIAIQDILDHEHIIFFDPLNQLTKNIIDYIPASRMESVILIDENNFEKLFNTKCADVSNTTYESIKLRIIGTLKYLNILEEKKNIFINISDKLSNAILLNKLLSDALSEILLQRLDTDIYLRHPICLFINQFQAFDQEIFNNLFENSSELNLGLIIMHEFLDQLQKLVATNIYSSFKTHISFRPSIKDSENLENYFSPEYFSTDLLSLDNDEYIIKSSVFDDDFLIVSSRIFSPVFRKYELGRSLKIL